MAHGSDGNRQHLAHVNRWATQLLPTELLDPCCQLQSRPASKDCLSFRSMLVSERSSSYWGRSPSEFTCRHAKPLRCGFTSNNKPTSCLSDLNQWRSTSRRSKADKRQSLGNSSNTSVKRPKANDPSTIPGDSCCGCDFPYRNLSAPFSTSSEAHPAKVP